jgi:phospholipase C
MTLNSSSSTQTLAVFRRTAIAAAASATVFAVLNVWAADTAREVNDAHTASPIKHVIVIIGENRTFDHVFATYKPSRSGETVDNLLSKGIINADGSPGPNFDKFLQKSAVDQASDGYRLSPGTKRPYTVLPTPLAGGPTTPYVPSVPVAMQVQAGLPDDYYVFLTTGGTGLKGGTPDTRIQNGTQLPPGPFQLTSKSLPYDAYAASPVHRFYQMWQQLDCRAEHASERNPSGCSADLFPWVEVTVGAGANGQLQPVGFNAASTGEGATAMGFYNVQQGDAPYLKYLADHYAISDNFHQAVMGGTGANHVMFGTGDAIWFSDGRGNPAVPPHNQMIASGTANAGIVDEIENPNPQPGTNNFYTQDGYGGGSYGSPSFGGGTYTNCADNAQPGVDAVRDYLETLPSRIGSRCAPGHYYLLNNYNPGYFGDGSNAYTDLNKNNTVFTIPPSTLRNIGDALLERKVSWRYYGDQWNRYLQDPYEQSQTDVYCNICNFFQYSTSIMTNAAVRTTHLKDTLDLYADIKQGWLPAVAFVKPSGLVDGHPASSKLNLFEGFTKYIVDAVQAQPKLWADTAIIVTFDEGGGYFDSGYVQPVDYFGDGTRIPVIVVSPHTKAGHVSHDYADHVSVLKFVERNWGLSPLTERSRDNLPNPVHDAGRHRYAPSNSPAISDMFDMFDFSGE